VLRAALLVAARNTGGFGGLRLGSAHEEVAAAPDAPGKIEVDRREYMLGDSVEARVSTSGLTPLSQGRVVLGQARTTEVTSGARFETPAITTLDREIEEVAGADVSADETGSVNQRVVLQIPPRAVPSVGLEIQWHVVGAFDEGGAIVKSPAFRVLAPRETFQGLLHPMPDEHPELRLDVGDRCVRCGDTLDGRLVFTPAKDTRVRDVSVRLESGLETDGRTLFNERVEFGGDIQVACGETREFPFSIPIGRNAGPTAWDYPTDDSAGDAEVIVIWCVYGTLKAGRWFGETEVYAPIHVYNGP
jgi:hypothetical protein